MKGFLGLDFILFSLSKPECFTKKSINLHIIHQIIKFIRPLVIWVNQKMK
jgi:hypothetical protein